MTKRGMFAVIAVTSLLAGGVVALFLPIRHEAAVVVRDTRADGYSDWVPQCNAGETLIVYKSDYWCARPAR